MSTWQNLPSLSHKYGDKRKRNCTVQNLFGGMLACYVLLQLIIFLIALSFAIRVHTTGPVILPSVIATFAKGQPRIMSYVVTLTATVMSFLNTHLLGLVLEAALKARMGRPISLQVFRGWFSLVTGQKLLGFRSFRIFWAWIKSLACMHDGRKRIAPSDRQYWKWLIYTVIYAAVCGPLTSSWTSFLTPTPVEILTHFLGKETDLIGVAHLPVFGNLAPYPSGSSPLVTFMNATRSLAMDGYGLSNVTPFLQAGFGAATNELGSPYSVSFMGSLYNGSTGGVYTNLSTVIQDAGRSMPEGLTQTYTMYHQGFGAEVHCRQQPFLDAVGVYPSAVVYTSVTPGISSTASNQTVTADYNIQNRLMVTNCSSTSVAYTNDILTLSNADGYILGDGYLIGSVCKYQDFEKATNQSFLVLMQGPWQDEVGIEATICEVSPRITLVHVEFDGSTVSIVNTTNSQPLSPDGQEAVYIDFISNLIWMMMFDAQSISGNSMVGGIQSVSYDALLNDTLFNEVLENYLRGSIELFGTIWRQNFQENDPPVSDYNGIIHVRSFGYQYRRSTYLFLLVPLTLVVFATFGAAIYAPVAQPRNPVDVHLVEDGMMQEVMDGPLGSLGDSEHFDPTNVIHLMMAASRIRLNRKVGENEHLQVHLDSPRSNIRMAQLQEDDEEMLMGGDVRNNYRLR